MTFELKPKKPKPHPKRPDYKEKTPVQPQRKEPEKKETK